MSKLEKLDLAYSFIMTTILLAARKESEAFKQSLSNFLSSLVRARVNASLMAGY